MVRALPLLVLAAACATTGASRQDADALACGRGDSAACARRGLRALGGEGVPRDERDAAAWLMAACERGHGQSCADLGALYAAGRGVRQDDGRACDLGLADACTRAGRPPPKAARTPQVVLPAEPAPQVDAAAGADDMRRALEFARSFVPVHERERLGLTAAALEKDPPAPWSELERLRPLLDARRPGTGKCLPVYQLGWGDMEGRAIVSLTFGPDGRARDVVIALDVPAGAADAPADCIRDAVARWEFPRAVRAERIWFLLIGNGPPERLPEHAPADMPRYMAPGFRPPREKEPGCLAREAWRSCRFDDTPIEGTVLVKFAVRRDGHTSHFQVVTKLPALFPGPEVAACLRRVAFSCDFEPATDPGGTAVNAWVIQPVRFVAR